MSRRTKDKDETRHDLLQHLIDNGKRPDNGNVMSARDIIDQMAELLLAGSETTSGTLAYETTPTITPSSDRSADSPPAASSSKSPDTPKCEPNSPPHSLDSLSTRRLSTARPSVKTRNTST
jgi:hypothetical protein